MTKDDLESVKPVLPPELVDRIRKARDMKPGVCELLKQCEDCGVDVTEHLAICEAVDQRLANVQKHFIPSPQE